MIQQQKATLNFYLGIICLGLLSISLSAYGGDQEKAKPERSTSSASMELNPKFFYFFGGKLIGNRWMTVGDPKKWGETISDLPGSSASKKLKASKEDYQGKGDAIRLEFSRKKIKGDFGIYGSPINIDSVKDAAALTFDVKMITKPDKGVQIALDCGYPCRAEVEVARQLRKLPKNEWAVFPIPLNCFKSDDFDLKKINGVFVIGTEGKLKLSVANVRLEKLPAGNTGCTE